jgi:Domain of unknown function (DUF4168)
MTLTRKVLAAGAVAAFVAFPIPGVFAQSSGSMNDSGSAASAPPSEGAPAAESAQPAQGSAQVDDATLQKAAKAYVKVKQIVHQTKQAESASNGAQPDQSAAQSEKIAAVKNAGLDPQQYDQVIQMVQNDPSLQQKFANYVNQNGGDTD